MNNEYENKTGKRNQPRLHVLSYISISEQNSDKTVGRVVDISSQGMRLASNHPVEPARVLQFKMQTPAGNTPICFDAWVIWCRRSSTHGSYDSGIELRNVSQENLHAIEQFLEESAFADHWLTMSEFCRPEEY